MEFRVKPHEIGARLLADERARQEHIAAAVVEAAEFALEMLFKPSAPFDTGMLRASGHVEVNPAGAQILLDAPHAALVELGQRPHWLPLQPLLDWVNRHKAAFGVDDESDVQRIARAIQAKIAREGTQPSWYVKGNLPAARIALGRLIRDALHASGVR